jgi:hypothetical protein
MTGITNITIGGDVGGADELRDRSPMNKGRSSSGLDSTQADRLIEKYIEGMFKDGTVSKNELSGMDMLRSMLDKLYSGEETGTGDSATDPTDAGSLTAGDFTKAVEDKAKASKFEGVGENRMRDAADALVEAGASPEDMQAFLDEVDTVTEGDGNVTKDEGSELKGFGRGLLAAGDKESDTSIDGADTEDDTQSLDEASDAGDSTADDASELTYPEFMKQVADLAAESEGGYGPGEKMMMKAAETLKGSSAESMQAYLDEAKNLLNNADKDHNNKDIDQTTQGGDGGEGDILTDLANALKDSPSEGDTEAASSSASGSSSSSTDETDSGGRDYDKIRDFLDRANASNGEISNREIDTLARLIDEWSEESDAASEQEAGSDSGDSWIDSFENDVVSRYRTDADAGRVNAGA